MNAPDTSPRWDWSSWQIDATRRALRTAAREGTPGRGGVDPNRRCRKKGLYMLLYDHSDCARFWTYPHELCQPIATNIKKPPPKGNWGRHASPGHRGLPDVLFHRRLGSPALHHCHEVRPVCRLSVRAPVQVFGQ